MRRQRFHELNCKKRVLFDDLPIYEANTILFGHLSDELFFAYVAESVDSLGFVVPESLKLIDNGSDRGCNDLMMLFLDTLLPDMFPQKLVELSIGLRVIVAYHRDVPELANYLLHVFQLFCRK